MKQTIEIEVPEGYKAVYNTHTQKVEIISATLPKTWEEYCKQNPIIDWEYFINERSEIDEVRKRERNPLTDMSTIRLREMAIAFRALMQLIQLRDCYWQGWKPDWKDKKNKFSIEIIDGEITTYWDNRRSRILSFQSIEVRDEFMENFRDLIEQAKELI